MDNLYSEPPFQLINIDALHSLYALVVGLHKLIRMDNLNPCCTVEKDVQEFLHIDYVYKKHFVHSR